MRSILRVIPLYRFNVSLRELIRWWWVHKICALMFVLLFIGSYVSYLNLNYFICCLQLRQISTVSSLDEVCAVKIAQFVLCIPCWCSLRVQSYCHVRVHPLSLFMSAMFLLLVR